MFHRPLSATGRPALPSNRRRQTCCKIPLRQMNAQHISPASSARRLSACLCLGALFFLWFPLWVAAWQSATMDCCSAGMCPAHGHKSQNSHSAPSQCNHGVTACSVSCCQSDAHTFVASGIFVLPSPPILSRTPQFTTSSSSIKGREVSSLIAPPDHPPRLFHS
jgi:hypothetical protein